MRKETIRDLAGVQPLQPVWLTSGEARRRLNISASTLKRLCLLGALEALPLGREKRFLTSDVEAFAALGVEKLKVIREGLAALSRKKKHHAARETLTNKKT